jgi:hypothetical protein
MKRYGNSEKITLRQGLTYSRIVIPYRQQTRQASVLRDTLKFGGFLFFGTAA